MRAHTPRAARPPGSRVARPGRVPPGRRAPRRRSLRSPLRRTLLARGRPRRPPPSPARGGACSPAARCSRSSSVPAPSTTSCSASSRRAAGRSSCSARASTAARGASSARLGATPSSTRSITPRRAGEEAPRPRRGRRGERPGRLPPVGLRGGPDGRPARAPRRAGPRRRPPDADDLGGREHVPDPGCDRRDGGRGADALRAAIPLRLPVHRPAHRRAPVAPLPAALRADRAPRRADPLRVGSPRDPRLARAPRLRARLRPDRRGPGARVAPSAPTRTRGTRACGTSPWQSGAATTPRDRAPEAGAAAARSCYGVAPCVLLPCARSSWGSLARPSSPSPAAPRAPNPSSNGGSAAR